MQDQQTEANQLCKTIKNASRFVLTNHARLRMAQRNISLVDIKFVVKQGKRFHRAGAIFFHLRGRDIPEDQRHNKRLSRLEGTTVVLSRKPRVMHTPMQDSAAGEKTDVVLTPVVLTVWRNRQDGLSKIKQKPEYDCHNFFGHGIPSPASFRCEVDGS